MHSNDNSRGAQTLLTSSLLICNWNFVSYRRMDFCCLWKTVFNSLTILSPGRFPHLRDFALKLCSTFGSTYMCEAAFYRAALYATRLGDRKAVCPSVCPFVRQTRALWLNQVPSEKSSIMTRKSTASFPVSIRLTANVALQAPKGVSKRKVTVFLYSKNGLFSKKVCQTASLCENFQRYSSKAFIGL